MKLTFKGKSAIVTGACGGMGLEVCKNLSNNNILVLMIDIKEPPKPFLKVHKNCSYKKVDVTVREAIRLVSSFQREQGRQFFQRNYVIICNDKVTIEGKLLTRSNIGDSVSDVKRTRKKLLQSRFLNVLSKANVPDEFVRNKAALAKFRKSKSGYVSHCPPGLPELQ